MRTPRDTYVVPTALSTRTRRRLALVATLLAALPTGYAATYTWDGVSGDDFSTAANYNTSTGANNSTALTTADTLNFSSSGTQSISLTTGSASIINFTGSSVGEYTIGNSSGTLTLGNSTSSGIFLASSVGSDTDQTINANIAINSNRILLENNASDSASSLAFGGNFTATTTPTSTPKLVLQGTGTGTNTLSGVISGAIDFHIGGQSTSTVVNSTWIVSGTNTYTGTTGIYGGTVIASNSSAFGSNTVPIVIGGTLTSSSTTATATNSKIALLLSGTDTTLSRTLSIGGSANTGGYTVTLGGANTSGTTNFTGNITFSNTDATTVYTITLQAATGGTVNFNGSTFSTNSRAIAIGSSGNTGTVKISRAAGITTTGGLSVNFGTLSFAGAAATGASTDITLASGTTLDSEVSTTTFGGNITGTSASVALNGTSAGSYTLASGKTFTMTGGTLTMNIGTASGVSLGSSDQIIGSGTGTFSLSGVALVLSPSSVNYTSTYQLFSGFTSGSISSTTISGYDTTNYLAALSNSGALTFTSISAIPEPATYASLVGLALLGFASYRRRRPLSA